MKKWAIKLLVLVPLLLGVGKVLAQTNGGFVCSGPITVASTTVPVSVIPPARMTTFEITDWDSTIGALCFPYAGPTVPTAVPSPSPEHRVAPSSEFTDAVTCDATTCTDAIGQGWACVIQSSGSISVDGCYR